MAKSRTPRAPDAGAASGGEGKPTRRTVNTRFYSAEFKQQMVAMVRAGRTPDDLAQDFEPAAQTIPNGVLQADRDDDELARLRRADQMLREEKEILKRAAAWFAQESLSTPPKRSGS